MGAVVDDRDAVVGRAGGQRVLDEWESLRSKFVKIFPVDYKRVLAERAAAEAAASNGAAPSPNGAAATSTAKKVS